jgi:hypothetical protein
MAARRCPNCALVNPGSAQTCDCGYSFVFDEAPRQQNSGDPVANWFGNQNATSQRFIVRVCMFAFLFVFALGIAMCSR